MRVLRVEGYADRSAGSPPQVPATETPLASASTHGPAAEALRGATSDGAAALALVPADSESAEGTFPPIRCTTSLEEMFGHTLSAAISASAIDSEDELDVLCAFGSGLAGKVVEGTDIDYVLHVGLRWCARARSAA